MSSNQQPALLRSCRSNQIAYIKFCNRSSKEIDLEWIDFRGQHKLYKANLKPLQTYSVKSYVGHPWMVYESKYRYPMVFLPDLVHVHFPEASRMVNGAPSQSVVNILTPLVSLQTRCLQSLHILMQNKDLDRLSLAPMLKRRLEKLFFSQKHHDLPVRMIEP